MMDESLRNEIRELVHAEMSSSRHRTPSGLEMVARTRSLIRQSTESACNSNSPASRFRTSPGHPQRIVSSGKKRKRESKEITFELSVLSHITDAEATSSSNTSVLSDDAILVKHLMVVLMDNMTEEEIRSTIADSLKNKFPQIKPLDFEFVKRDRNRIYTPCYGDSFKWNFPQIRKLVGQGKLYIRFLKPHESVIRNVGDHEINNHNAGYQSNHDDSSNTDSSDNENDIMNTLALNNASIRVRSTNNLTSNRACSSRDCSTNSGPLRADQPSSSREFSNNNRDMPCSSRDRSTDVETTLLSLAEIFPNTPVELRQNIARRTATLEEAANAMASLANAPDNAMDKLTQQLSGKPKVRVFIDENHVVEDAFSYYKSPSFDPTRPIKIVFGVDGSNSPGVDAGGLMRHFFSRFFYEISNSTCRSKQLFEGEPPFLLPIMTAETCVSEIFLIIGKMIAHYICHGGEGLPVLSPSIYMYLTTGSIKDSMLDLNQKEVASPLFKHYIERISGANTEEIVELSSDETLCTIIDEIGELGLILSESTKQKVIQSMIVYDVLVRRKHSLDHMRQGLETLNVLDTMKSFPNEMKKFFVQLDEINGEDVINQINYCNGTTAEKECLNKVLRELTVDNLKRFLITTTGAPTIWALNNRKLNVKFIEGSTIAASTCFFHLNIPKEAVAQDILQVCIESILSDSGRSFNTL